jgi:hypothetical protein
MLIRRILILISALSVILFLWYAASKSQNLTHGFASHYTFSRLLLSERNIDNAYDTAYFNLKIRQYGFADIRDITNLPTSSLTLLPIAWMKPPEAKAAWTIISVISVFASVIILFYCFGISYKSNLGLLLICATFLFYPVYNNLYFGQSYIVMLLLFSAAIYGLRINNLLFVYVSISLLFLYKGYGMMPLLALLFTGRYKEFSTSVIITAALILITMPVLHFESWLLFYQRIFSMLGLNEDASNTAYQTLLSFFSRLFAYNELKNPFALLNFPQPLIYYTVQALGLAAIYLISKKLNKSGVIPLFTASIGLNVIFAPVAEEHCFVFFLPLIYLTGKYIYENYKSIKLEPVFFIIALFLLAAPLKFKALQFSSFPVYLLGYPRLYGGILIIITLLSVVSKIPSLPLSNKTADALV